MLTNLIFFTVKFKQNILTLLGQNHLNVIKEGLNRNSQIQNMANRGRVFILVSLESGYVEHRAQ